MAFMITRISATAFCAAFLSVGLLGQVADPRLFNLTGKRAFTTTSEECATKVQPGWPDTGVPFTISSAPRYASQTPVRKPTSDVAWDRLQAQVSRIARENEEPLPPPPSLNLLYTSAPTKTAPPTPDSLTSLMPAQSNRGFLERKLSAGGSSLQAASRSLLSVFDKWKFPGAGSSAMQKRGAAASSKAGDDACRTVPAIQRTPH